MALSVKKGTTRMSYIRKGGYVLEIDGYVNYQEWFRPGHSNQIESCEINGIIIITYNNRCYIEVPNQLFLPLKGDKDIKVSGNTILMNAYADVGYSEDTTMFEVMKNDNTYYLVDSSCDVIDIGTYIHSESDSRTVLKRILFILHWFVDVRPYSEDFGCQGCLASNMMADGFQRGGSLIIDKLNGFIHKKNKYLEYKYDAPVVHTCEDSAILFTTMLDNPKNAKYVYERMVIKNYYSVNIERFLRSAMKKFTDNKNLVSITDDCKTVLYDLCLNNKIDTDNMGRKIMEWWDAYDIMGISNIEGGELVVGESYNFYRTKLALDHQEAYNLVKKNLKILGLKYSLQYIDKYQPYILRDTNASTIDIENYTGD